MAENALDLAQADDDVIADTKAFEEAREKRLHDIRKIGKQSLNDEVHSDL